MKEDATIWVSGTMHNIFSVGQILTKLGFKILNVITWEKSNPPPNFSCRFFTHSTEQIIWARKNEKVPHYYNYELMKQLNDNKQMKDVWKLPAIAPWEKSCGKHPTQKPLSVLTRLILASTKPNAWILDPFAGSSTTGIAANLANRRFLGIDQEEDFLTISKNRKLEIEKLEIVENYRNKIVGFIDKRQFKEFLNTEIAKESEKITLGFCRAKDIQKLKKGNVFYFYAIKSDSKILDFPTGIHLAKKIFIYTGGRSKPIKLSGLYGEIKSVNLKHKSTIKGKENSNTEYYYEVELHQFIEDKNYIFTLDTENLFEKTDIKNREMFKKYLPTITTIEKLQKLKSLYKTDINYG